MDADPAELDECCFTEMDAGLDKMNAARAVGVAEQGDLGLLGCAG